MIDPRRALALLAVACCACAGSSGTGMPPPHPCVTPASGLPTDVFCTGLYANNSAAQLKPEVMAYTPGVTLWSDGAEKRRFLLLPPGGKIDTSTMDDWKFPVGTKVWKEFKVGGVLIETRLLWKRSDIAWDIGTYIWDSTGTTATLNSNPKGMVLSSGYEIPTAKDCDRCHQGASDKILGVEAVALALPQAKGATLAVLAEKGLLSDPPSTRTIQLPEDSTGKAAEALGYLHANCGMPCHSTRGLGEETHLVLRLQASEFWPDGSWNADAGTGHDPASFPLPATMTDAYKAMIKQRPTTGAVAQAFPGAYRVTPGAHDQSLVWMISHIRGKYQMPPLVSHLVDDEGMQKLADWIDALPK